MRKTGRKRVALALVVSGVAAVLTAGPGVGDAINSERYRADSSSQAMFGEEVDYVVPRQDLDQFLQANPELGESQDVVIGVDYTDLPDVESRSLPQDIGSLTAEEVVAIANAGGDLAVETDARMAAANPDGRADALQICALPPPDPTAQRGIDVYFPCSLSVPTVTAVQRPSPQGDAADRVHGVLSYLTQGPTDAEQLAGLTPFLPDDGQLDIRASVEDAVAIVDFQSGVQSLGIDTAAASAAFFDSIVLSVLDVPGVDAIRFEVQGSCRRFAAIFGDTSCETFEMRG